MPGGTWREDFVKTVAGGEIGGNDIEVGGDGIGWVEGIKWRPGVGPKPRGLAGKLQGVGKRDIRGQGFGRVCVAGQDAGVIQKQNHEKQKFNPG